MQAYSVLSGTQEFPFKGQSTIAGSQFLLLPWFLPLEKASPACHPQDPGITQYHEAAPQIADRRSRRKLSVSTRLALCIQNLLSDIISKAWQIGWGSLTTEDRQKPAGIDAEGCWKSLSLSHVHFFVTPWTVAHQASLFLEFSRQGILESVSISFSRGSFLPRDWTQVSCILGRLFIIWVTRETSKQNGNGHCQEAEVRTELSALKREWKTPVSFIEHFHKHGPPPASAAPNGKI